MISKREKNIAMLSHLLPGILSFIPLLSVFVIIFYYKKIGRNQTSFIKNHMMESARYQVASNIIALLFIFILFISIHEKAFITSLFLLIVCLIYGIVTTLWMISAANSASKGQYYRYPLFRLFKKKS